MSESLSLMKLGETSCSCPPIKPILEPASYSSGHFLSHQMSSAQSPSLKLMMPHIGDEDYIIDSFEVFYQQICGLREGK